jgi:MerR family transcriptional regulator, thiopeptide resistance regulator
MLLKIGELAKRSGVTIRALRHYDEIRLLVPSARSEGRFRLYDQNDVAKLYRIQALSRLNLPLAEIQRILTAGAAALPGVIEQQIAFLQHQIEHAAALRDHLTQLQAQIRQCEAPSMNDWLGALERMSASSSYFSDDELQGLSARGNANASGEDKARLTKALGELMRTGAAADTAAAKELAMRWMALLMDEVGGDEGLLMKYYAMQWNETALHSLSGIDREAMIYISHAMAYRRLDIYARYCTEEEIARLRSHYVRHTNAWPALIAAIREQMNQGGDPASLQMQGLARRWLELSREKAGGDRHLAAKLRQAFECEPALRFASGIDAPLLAYLGAAFQTLQSEPQA